MFEIVEAARPGDRASKVFDLAIIGLIVLNVAAMIAESMPECAARWPGFFMAFERVSIGVFIVEYVLRLWSCVESDRFSKPLLGRLRFARTPMAIVDFFAIAPGLLPFVGLDLRVVRMLRAFRLLRIAKLSRYTRALGLIGRTLTSKKEALITTGLFMVMLILISSTLMYFAERDAQPQHFGTIPNAMWWSIVTLTTVGYGDAYPVTAAGRVLASIIAILGVGMVALPTGILGAGFVEELSRNNHSPVCPHCGGRLHG
ncbi:MAG: ion transporter [Phycisphaerales bacterium]|nr:ion transporter [Phycisphaerales bacterium]